MRHLLYFNRDSRLRHFVHGSLVPAAAEFVLIADSLITIVTCLHWPIRKMIQSSYVLYVD